MRKKLFYLDLWQATHYALLIWNIVNAELSCLKNENKSCRKRNTHDIFIMSQIIKFFYKIIIKMDVLHIYVIISKLMNKI